MPLTEPEIGSWEDVRRCPMCKSPGIEVDTVPIRIGRSRGGKLITLECRTVTSATECKWNETRWTVQINPDGTIYQPKPQSKQYEDPGPLTQRGKEDLAAQERALLNAVRTDGGGTVRNR